MWLISKKYDEKLVHMIKYLSSFALLNLQAEQHPEIVVYAIWWVVLMVLLPSIVLLPHIYWNINERTCLQFPTPTLMVNNAISFEYEYEVHQINWKTSPAYHHDRVFTLFYWKFKTKCLPAPCLSIAFQVTNACLMVNNDILFV